MHMKHFRFPVLFIAVLICVAPAAAYASLTPGQISSVLALLRSFGADAAAIANVETSLSGGTPSGGGTSAPNLKGALGSKYVEDRAAVHGSTYDSYFGAWGNTNGTCTIELYNLSSGALLWSTSIPNCTSVGQMAFHQRSFMGDASHDFTAVISANTTATNVLGYWLIAGDGATGKVRDWRFQMGNCGDVNICRTLGYDVVDFKLTKYPGPGLIVRNNGGGYDQHAHLFYFPSSSNGVTDVTADASVFNFSIGTVAGYSDGSHVFMFPGTDVPVPQGNVNLNTYTQLYNAFNPSKPCTQVSENAKYGLPFSGCGTPDGNTVDDPYYNTGDGEFMGQLNVGDIDSDGVDDVLTTYFWRSVVYPGRPNGQAANLGAPQYDEYYNPQQDNSDCAEGRRYGLMSIANTGGAYPYTVAIGGVPTGGFWYEYQNVSRYVSVISSAKGAAPTLLSRSLLWNRVLNTSKSADQQGNPYNCNIAGNGTLLYGNAVHYPGDAMFRDTSDVVRYVTINRWTQVSPTTWCDHNDAACHTNLLKTQQGYWTWEVMDAQTGKIVKSVPNMYVWDYAQAGGGYYWLVYSSNANVWDLGVDSTGVNPTEFRPDLTVATYDPQTKSISNVQPLSFSAAPLMRSSPWSNFGGVTASSYDANRLFWTPMGDGTTGFVVQTPNGYALMRLNGNVWIIGGNYDASGNLLTTLATPTDLSTSCAADGSATLGWTGSGTGIVGYNLNLGSYVSGAWSTKTLWISAGTGKVTTPVSTTPGQQYSWNVSASDGKTTSPVTHPDLSFLCMNPFQK